MENKAPINNNIHGQLPFMIGGSLASFSPLCKNNLVLIKAR